MKFEKKHARGRYGALGKLLYVAVLLGAMLLSSVAQARDIVDMAGRAVVVPNHIVKVYGSSPPMTLMLYAMDPALIAGLNSALNEEERTYLPRETASLPVLGGWFGQGRTPNLESIMAVHPDIMLGWWSQDSAANDKMEKTAASLDIPLVYLTLDHLEQYAGAFLFLGRLFGMEARGRRLSEYARDRLAEVAGVVATIPEEAKPTIYYAEGPHGLRSECDQSRHAQLINLVGGRNIINCPAKDGYGMQAVSLEQVLLSDPRIILAKERVFFEQVYQDPRWAGVRAVKDRRVYLIPSTAFNWFDRPPSFMRLLGIQWLANIAHPERRPKDMIRETGDFLRLFLGLDLAEPRIREVLNR
ncbi:MAG: ABC transporter substrate-binding protein [Pseudomonadota bacterium]